MKKILFLAFLSVSTAHAALFSLSGNHRFGSNWFYNLDTTDGKNPGASDSTAYLEHRLIIRPDIIVDERFSIRTEMSLLSQNSFDTYAGTVYQTNGGGTLDSELGNKRKNPADQSFHVRSAYLKWNSEIGIFRAGRMPKGWGLGLLYDEGMDAEDISSTIADRMSFEGQLGSLVLTAAFEKYEEGSLYQDIDDDEVYEGSVKYENESAGVGIGLLFSRHVRAVNAVSRTGASGYSSSNEVSFFAKKEWEKFSIGGEVVSVSYDDQADVFGALAQMRWNPGNWNVELDGLFSSESGGRAFLVNPNYRPFLILYRQSLGGNVGAASGSRYGRGIGFDPGNPTQTENGAILGRVGFFYNFSQGKYRLGLSGGYAQMLEGNSGTPALPGPAVAGNNNKDLGIEADFHFEQKWYDNFKTELGVGVLKPGGAFPGSELVFGGQVKSYLNF